ncbi:cytochrome b [Pseudomonas ovata]|uniref:cytochrome b n=1 Tax=Pseudomonas ovata TaxID=1839709 RepID=UPI000D69151A|nr:cytochrome b/b6 domain-containing protein [Pseudomonas ovata]
MKPSNPPAPRHFNTLARLLHWLMALMILAMLFIGVGMVSSVHHRLFLIDLHRPLGLAILLLALVRLLNRLTHTPPPLPASVPGWQAFVAKASHWLLYALMLVLPVLGWALLSAGGYPVTVVTGWNLPAIVPASPQAYAWLRDAHGWLAWTLFATVLAHLSAALLHAWVLRDGVFSQMTWRKR